MLQRINHRNIINLTEGKSGGELNRLDGIIETVEYISLELAENGDLSDYIFYPDKGFEEYFSRYLFKEMMNGLKACHQSGVVHRDLKTENLMMTKDFVLKIADFGYSALKVGKYNNNLLDSYLGTFRYMAPEILENKPYYGEQADIFSSGIILFILVTGNFLFGKADIKSDYDFRNFVLNDLEEFWEENEQILWKFSTEFKSLVSLMISYNPADRPSVSEILNHPWLTTLTIPTEEEIFKEFTDRDKIVKSMKEEEKEKLRIQEELKIQEKKIAPRNNKNKVYK